MITKKMVNKAIAERFEGLEIYIDSDESHNFWFGGRDVEYWFDTSIMIWTLNQFTIDKFLSEVSRLLKQNENRKPIKF